MEKIKLENIEIDILLNFLGSNDKKLKIISDYFNTDIYFVKDELMIEDGEKKDDIIKVIDIVYELAKKNILINEKDVLYIAKSINSYDKETLLSLYTSRKEIIRTYNGKSVYPKTFSQKKYIKELEDSDVIFGYGAAGTGKTYLATCYAVQKLKDQTFKKIIITRPVVEAGESLGFLPGDLKEKIDPYLRPIYDALNEVLGQKKMDEYLESGVIEIAPLAYMRGRTLDNSFVILDEAQNTSINQMKLFLTRLGFNSKMVITGDITQIDLPKSKESGLVQAIKILKGIKGISIIEFDIKDVVRNPLIQKILERFNN